jgi:hypothetical protein
MEILTVVLEGALEHRDSSGVRTVLRAGDVQRMSAGRGVMHSEWNDSEHDPVRFLQIWLLPERWGLAPDHEEARGVFPVDDGADEGLRLLVARDAAEADLRIGQDAAIHGGRVAGETVVRHGVAEGRGVWVQVVRGEIEVNGTPLEAGDALAIEDEGEVTVAGRPAGDFLLFDLA